MTCPLCDPRGYELASWLHADAHDAAGTDVEACDDADCPHWPQMPECDCDAEVVEP